MGQSKIKFGDKLFVYGQFLQLLPDYEEMDYNVLIDEVLVHGFVVDFGTDSQFTVETPFTDLELVDVTDKLAKRLPILDGNRIWAPTTGQPEVYFPRR